MLSTNTSYSNSSLIQPINIVAADDHLIFLQGLSSLLDLSANLELSAFASDGDALVVLIEQHQPDIALIDLSMPGPTTEEILEAIHKYSPHTKVIALTMHMEAPKTQKLFELGLDGYILKESAFEELTTAIETVLKDEHFISNEMKKALEEYSKRNDNVDLTDRERQVLENAALGQSNKEIARTLFITERTVRFHLSNCCLKLKAHGRSNAVAIALKKSLINY